MKRILLLVLLTLILVAGISAQQETWIDNSGGMSTNLPSGMVNEVTQGLMYDEWDIIFRSPAELSNYTGIGVYTAYGNYGNPGGYTVNPFSTGALNMANIGSFQAGLTGDILGMRAGILGGFTRTTTGQITLTEVITTSLNPTSFWEYSREEVGDGDADDIADFSYDINMSASHYSQNHNNQFILGLDLGPIGASILFSHGDNRIFKGGSTSYTWSEGSDVDFVVPADQITSASTVYGGKEGNPVVVSNTGGWLLAILGDLPLTLFGEGTPVTASLNIGFEPNSPAAMPVTTTLTTGNVTGAANADQLSTLTVTSGSFDLLGSGQTGFTDAWLTSVGTVENSTLTGAGLVTYAESAEAATYAQNSEFGAGGTFSIGLNAKIDPRFSLSETFALRTRAGIGYGLGSGGNDTNLTYSVNLAYANGAADLSSFTKSSTRTATNTTTTHTLAPELGGILEFRTEDNRLELSTGLVYHPTFEFASTTKGDLVVVTERSWTDETGTDPEAVAANAAADIAIGTAQGSSVVRSTTTYAGSDGDNTYTHIFSIPVGVRFDIVPKKFQIFGGYRMDHTITTRVVTAAGSTTTSTTTVNNSAGTTVSPDPVATAVSTSESESATRRTTTTWNGTMNFMLRWNATENLTIDLFGNSIMTALNFGLFGGGAGLNFNTLISALGMSVSFRF